jgi:3-methylcrotonyl-CoA carboxylase alpha subunit/geranyl-CoA carboxylase alpha subunit
VRILVANRGEIARRIQRTAARLGHETVAVYADPDRDAPFVADADSAVRLGPAPLADSYLSIERLLDAAQTSGATAVHPGYGFLSENAGFAAAVADAGFTWIGPNAKAIEQMGSKIEARRLAAAAGVATIPGFDRSQDPKDLAAAAERIGFPVLVKAAAGGGGKGIRIVREVGELAAGIEEAAREAERAFGDAALIVERFVERARHVEVQVVGDRHGNVVHLGTRECSVQRRYQKLLEEAPAPNLSVAAREGLCDSALELARSIGYDSTGTVEFVVDDATGEYFFMEMNTRLQVEHPVTEAITGLDLVELQLRSAEGEPLPISQADVRFEGHAFEARINAEDASAGFVPQTGTIAHLRIPEGVRWDSGIEHGSEITPHYDPLIAKLVSHGPDRETARRRLGRALDVLLVGGLVTNAGFQRWLIEQPPVVEGRVTTRFLDENGPPEDTGVEEAAAAAAHAWLDARSGARESGAWSALGSFRVTPHQPVRTVALADLHGEIHEIDVTAREAVRVPSDVDRATRSVAVNLAGHTHTFRVLSRSERWAPSAAEGHGGAEAALAPFPAVVTEIPVAPGDAVAAGDVVVVIEAMKMLHSLTARGAGTVAEVRVAVGDSVVSNQVLVTFESEDPDEAELAGD